MRKFKWAPLIALCSGQFIMVLDSTVMNVSIERVITDLDTTVSKMQLAIATYTLTTAALMLIGGKVGDMIGRRLALRIGMFTFGLGALITSLSQSVGILILGWSVLEAIGAALMIPAIISLIASNYEGKDRVVAYGAIGGIAGAAAAAGPIIGGAVATVGSWRDVFAAEAVIVVFLLFASLIVKDAPLGRAKPQLDAVGGLLSASGLGLAVLGIVQSSTWGWITPKEDLVVGGNTITPLGLSIVPFLIGAGCVLIAAFAWWERRVIAAGRDAIVELSMLRLPELRAGLMTMIAMFLCLGGTFFAVPLYLQIVLGNDPFQTGVDILPMSMAVFFVAMGASRLSTRIAPRTLIQGGFVCVMTGSVLLLLAIEPTLDEWRFGSAVFVIGVGLGLIASQATNVNMASAGPAKTSETGALQGTSQNLGSALGTAIIGSLLLGVLTHTFDNRVSDDPRLPAQVQTEVASQTKDGLTFVPASAASATLKSKGVPPDVIDQLETDYSQSQIDALKIAIGGVAAIALLGLGVTRRLPATPLRGPPEQTVA